MVPILWWLFIQGLGYCGALFIAYSVISMFARPYPPFEKVAEFFSTFLTLIGVLVTAASIYAHQESTYPLWRSSQRVVAPFVIIGCVVACIYLAKRGSLPPVLVNGFALLGISGALQRITPVDPSVLGALVSK